MKILVINGTLRHGSTWHIKQLLVNELSKNRDVTISEVVLPKDLPEYCVGCFQCISNGEYLCPHAAKVSAIEQAIVDADCIIMTSPVYSMDVSAGLKNLLDHMAYRWMPHRPHPTMFKKVAITITTAAGSGTAHTTKTMRSSLQFWGIAQVFSMKFNVAAMKFDDIKEQKKIRIEKAVESTARKVARHLNKDKVSVSLKTRMIFMIMRMMHKGNDWNMTDHNHWQENGWLDKVRPY